LTAVQAWAVEEHRLVEVERPAPEPGRGEVRVRVHACGVCRTDLHLLDGDVPARRPGVVPGHEVVGVVDRLGEGSTRFAPGDRVGVAWLRWTCGVCRFCLRGDENLCVAARFTGWDDDGGYAEYAVVDERYAYGLPDEFDDEHAAPLLCSGIIGYRALRRAALPPGGRLGIYGFGASAHLAAQIAVHEGATVHVVTRSAANRRLALDLGAASAGDAAPEPLDAAVLFAPDGGLVPVALAALDRGGTLAIAGIHLSAIPSLDYERHLFYERHVGSITANTRRDGEELLALAAHIPLEVRTTPFAFDLADRALDGLREGRVRGAAVLMLPK
jgi:propanol-preferring alcohol dehydrogenase